MQPQYLVFVILILLNILGCVSTPIIERKPSSESHVDYKFINNALGKSFEYVRPATPDGEPNCVATALRAGGYTPAFALSGTDSFYENLLPVCFSLRSENESPEEGDLGIIYEKSVPTLAHMVLFLGQNKVFEKPGPKNDQVFQENTWSEIMRKQARGSAEFQVWKYDPKIGCPIENLRKNFFENPKYQEFKLIGAVVDSKIYYQEWNSQTQFNSKRLQFLLAQKEKEFHSHIVNRGRQFNFKQSYPELYETLFLTDLLKTLIRIPGQ